MFQWVGDSLGSDVGLTPPTCVTVSRQHLWSHRSDQPAEGRPRTLTPRKHPAVTELSVSLSLKEGVVGVQESPEPVLGMCSLKGRTGHSSGLLSTVLVWKELGSPSLFFASGS